MTTPDSVGGVVVAQDARPARFALAKSEAQDIAFLLLLGLIALLGFRTTYDGWAFLAVGVVGLVVGLLVAFVAVRFNQPWITLVALTIASFFLLGGVIAARSDSIAGVIPTFSTIKVLASASVHGWKDLLTTLPPVDSTGPLLIVPYILGLMTGALGYWFAGRRQAAALPVLVPVALLAVVIALGTQTPAAAIIQGVIFALVLLTWIPVRARRSQTSTGSSKVSPRRLWTGVAALAVAGVGALVLGPNLPGADNNRTVVRDYVEPPFDPRNYPSPLVGFAKYTKGAVLYDRVLMHVTGSGLPSGYVVRIVTLDDYDHSVWGATSGTLPSAPGDPVDAFQRVGPTIPVPTPRGASATATITVSADYAAARDLSVWVPTVGEVGSISFAGPSGAEHDDSYRYNLATSSLVLAGDRLHAGDTYTLTANLPPTATQPVQGSGYGTTSLDPSDFAFMASDVSNWEGQHSSDSPWQQLAAIADHLRTAGAYTDPTTGYPPGHNLARLTTFAQSQQPTGDDEQYAATFALAANALGLPARVVLGAQPEPNGDIKGSDIHAWVEVHDSSGAWVLIDRKNFMPPTTQMPHKVQQQIQYSSRAQQAPPANPAPPSGDLNDQVATDANAARRIDQATSSGIPEAVVLLAKFVGIPVLIVGLIVGTILALKRRRRRIRRRSGSPATQVANGWRELLDGARDTGLKVDSHGTRREQALTLERRTAAALAHDADLYTFGPQPPDSAVSAQYWDHVEAAVSQMFNDLGPWRGLRARLSLKTIRNPWAIIRGVNT